MNITSNNLNPIITFDFAKKIKEYKNEHNIEQATAIAVAGYISSSCALIATKLIKLSVLTGLISPIGFSSLPLVIASLVVVGVVSGVLTYKYSGRVDDIKKLKYEFEKFEAQFKIYNQIKNLNDEAIAPFLIQHYTSVNSEQKTKWEESSLDPISFVKKEIFSEDIELKLIHETKNNSPFKALLPTIAKYIYWQQKASSSLPEDRHKPLSYAAAISDILLDPASNRRTIFTNLGA